MSVIYEVNLKVQRAIEGDFKFWLYDHIHDVLAIDGFESAVWFDTTSDEKDSQFVYWTMHYVLSDRPALDNYLEKHASRLRQPAIDKFGGQFVATRRILEPFQKF